MRFCSPKRIVVTALLSVTAFSSTPADTSDISQILLGRVQLFLQLGPGDPFVEPQPFGFAAAVVGVAPGRITAGAFQYSGGGPVISLATDDNETFNFGERFATLGALNAAFPAGTYNFDVLTVTDPTEVFTSIDLGGDFPVTIPKLMNSEWRSVVLQFDSRADFTFQSNQFDDFRFDPVHGSEVELMISDIFNNTVLDQYDDTGPTSTLTLPGGTLSPGIYVGRLLFSHIDQNKLDTASVGDFNALVTEFVISAVDGPPVVTDDTITVNAGQLFVYQIDATQLPSEFDASNLPPGVTFNPATGLIGGYPTTGGTYVTNISASNIVGTGTAQLTINVQQPSLAITSSTRAAGRVGAPFRFQVIAPGATANARVTAQGLPDGLQIDPVSGVISGTPTDAGDFSVFLEVTDGSTTADTVLLISLDDDPAFPAIISPTSVNLTPGQNFSYQINGAPISNAASNGLGTNAADAPSYSIIGDLPSGLNFDPKTGTISGVYQGHPQKNAGDANGTRLSGGALVGNVQLTATNSRGTSTVPLAFFTAPAGAVNISTRLAIAGGDNVLIGGFIVTGNAPKKLLVRALGPSLPVPGALQDPVLEIHGSDGTLITNDNWKTDDAQSVIDSQLPPTDDREAAIVAVVQPNVNYTAIVRGNNGTSGVALVELYDLGTAALDSSSNAKLANISTRGLVQTGDNVMIGGFIISQVQSKVIARAIGPSLASAGVQGALEDTTLELHSADGAVVAANDDWQTDQAQQIKDTGVPPTDPRESAVVATLNPGNYTAVVRGKNNTTGVALVEVYALQ